MPNSRISHTLKNRRVLLLSTTHFPPRAANPPFFNHLQHHIRQESIYDCADTQSHEVHLWIRIQVVQIQDLFSGLNRTLSVDSLPVFACELEASQCIRRHVADGPFDGRKVVPGLQEIRNVEREHTTHYLGDAEEHRHAVYGEASVREERVKGYAQALAATGDAEGVVGDDEVGLCVALEAYGEDGEDREEEAAEDFKGRRDGDVGEEEGFDAVHAVVKVAVEDVALGGVYSDIVEHCGVLVFGL